MRVAGDPEERLAAVLAMAAGLREARRASRGRGGLSAARADAGPREPF